MFFLNRFPQIEYWRKQWVKNTKVKATPLSRICSIHFEEKYLSGAGRYKLAINALPTLHLVEPIARVYENTSDTPDDMTETDNESVGTNDKTEVIIIASKIL